MFVSGAMEALNPPDLWMIRVVSLLAEFGHAADEQQRVERRLSDDHQERMIGQEILPVQVQGASDGDHGSGGGGFASLLVHLETKKQQAHTDQIKL